MKKLVIAAILAVGLSLALASSAYADYCVVEIGGECLIWITI